MSDEDERPYAKGPFNGEDRVRIGRMDERLANLVSRFDRFEREVREDRVKYVTKAEFDKEKYATKDDIRPFVWAGRIVGGAVILALVTALMSLVLAGAPV